MVKKTSIDDFDTNSPDSMYLVHQEVQTVPIDQVIPYDNNPRLNEDAVEYLKTNIKKVKFRNPVLVDKDMVVIAGHTRLMAAKALGMKHIDVIVADDMSPEDVKLHRLTDNKIAEKSGWDFPKLQLELDELKLECPELDLESFGFLEFDEPEPDDSEGEYDEFGGEETVVVPAEVPEVDSTRQFNVVISCTDEVQQEALYERMTEEGWECHLSA